MKFNKSCLNIFDIVEPLLFYQLKDVCSIVKYLKSDKYVVSCLDVWEDVQHITVAWACRRGQTHLSHLYLVPVYLLATVLKHYSFQDSWAMIHRTID